MEENIEEVKEKYKKDPFSIYDDRFFRSRRRRRFTYMELQVGKCLTEYFHLTSMVDFGCGLGTFLEGALSAGIKTVLGLEYSYENAKKYLSPIVKDYIKYGNVMESIDCGKFDCVLSVEVAEHILPEKSDIFVDNLVNASNGLIFMTAAPIGQGGTGHINEHDKIFWVEKLEKRSFKESIELRNKVMDEINNRKIWLPRHIRNNMMIFSRE